MPPRCSSQWAEARSPSSASASRSSACVSPPGTTRRLERLLAATHVPCHDVLSRRHLGEQIAHRHHVVIESLGDLVAHLLRRHFEHSGHGRPVEVEHEAADHDGRSPDPGRSRAADLLAGDVHIVDRAEVRLDAEVAVRRDERSHEELETLLESRRQAPRVKDPLREQLVPVEVHRTAADLAADDGQPVSAAVRDVHFLLQILEEADAHVGVGRTDHDDRVGSLYRPWRERPHGRRSASAPAPRVRRR